jgi:Ca2+-binding RTX toxin-like protein
LHDTTLSLKFSNIGTGAAAASTAGIYLSTDGTITTADILIGTIAIPSLAAGGSVSGNVTVPFPSSLTAGTYHLGVIADYNNQIAESNESNNASSGSLTVILGNSGFNTLTGTAGADEIIGLGSSDTLIGGAGNDTLIGGSGADHFRYNATTEGLDTIVDFSPGSDVLDFAHSAFGFSFAGTLSSANFIANATGPTNTSQKFWYNTSNFTLYYDADGSGPGAAHAMAQLENHAILNSSNIHLI